MKMFVILSVLVASSYAARLDNTYIPPASAHSAGGFNLDTPKLAQPSNIQNQYSAPQNQFQQQSYNQNGQQGSTFTSVQRGNGFQSVAAGSFSGSGHSGAPAQQNYHNTAQQQSYQAPAQQQSYQAPAPQQSYQQPAQQQYNTGYSQNAQSGYNNNQASTTPIPILKYENEPHQGDGRYRFEYLTGNGIMAQEEGYLNNPGAQYPDYPEQVAVGSYSYTAPDGQLISITYKADANGFQPEGAHLPTPPSLPAEYYEQVELQKKIAAEVEAEGQRILALQAQLAQNQPQGQQNQGHYQHQAQGGHQGHQGQQHNYQQQASSQVFQQQPHQGYNNNAQPAGGPQQQYLPPQQKYGKK